MKPVENSRTPIQERLVFVKAIVRGLASYIPPVSGLLPNRTGGSNSIRYCYSVWLRHMVMRWQSEIRPCPSTLAELGPGDSLGVGLAALICGAEVYYGLDVHRFAKPELAVEVFDGLLELFQRREAIPGPDEFPSVAPHLDSYAFPRFLFDLPKVFNRERISRLRSALGDFSRSDCPVRYIVPWNGPSVMPAGSVDLLLSHAVLELVSGLRSVYRTMYRWLKPGGFMSHQIDFGDPKTTSKWNGNWSHSDFVWNCLRGRRTYWGNREAHSAHIQLLAAAGFEIIHDLKQKDFSGLHRTQLAPRFRNLSDDDLTTRGAFILARKPVW